ncbi:MAG: hypothetical protein K2K70_10045 [Lachnospiraceae bacterium]|nr:hypothetical protein [Lachnospiraceae bacterium]
MKETFKIMKETLKNNKKLIPLILYPYAYWINGTFFGNSMFLALIYNIYVLFITIYYPIFVIYNKIPAHDAAMINLLIKGLQIPAYLYHFILGIAGVAIGPIFGVPIIIWVIIVDWITIMLTGICSIGCHVQMKREGLISTVKAFWMLIGSFVYCIDVFIAIKYVIICKKITQTEISSI